MNAEWGNRSENHRAVGLAMIAFADEVMDAYAGVLKGRRPGSVAAATLKVTEAIDALIAAERQPLVEALCAGLEYDDALTRNIDPPHVDLDALHDRWRSLAVETLSAAGGPAPTDERPKDAQGSASP